jgi:hypothetical protein
MCVHRLRNSNLASLRWAGQISGQDFNGHRGVELEKFPQNASVESLEEL